MASVPFHNKANFAEQGASQSFRLSKKDGFEWLGECDATIEDVVSSSESTGRMSKLEMASDFLRDALAHEAMASVELAALAEGYGITPATLKRAKEAVGVEAKRVNGHWRMGLSE